MSTAQERESELYKILGDLEEAQYQCNRDERQIEQMEEVSLEDYFNMMDGIK